MQKTEVLERIKQAKHILAPIVDKYRDRGMDNEMNQILNQICKFESMVVHRKLHNEKILSPGAKPFVAR